MEEKGGGRGGREKEKGERIRGRGGKRGREEGKGGWGKEREEG